MPVQGILRRDERRPPVPHNLQRGLGCRHPPLGEGGDTNRGGTGGLGLIIIDLAAYFYADDSLLVSNQLERIQRAFDVLTGLFEQVGLQTNKAKTIGMVCQPCHVPGRMS